MVLEVPARERGFELGRELLLLGIVAGCFFENHSESSEDLTVFVENTDLLL